MTYRDIPPGPTWLQDISFAALAREIPSDLLVRALRVRFHYVSGPTLGKRGSVSARVQPTNAPRAAHGMGDVSATPKLFPDPENPAVIRSECTCRAPGMCVHAVALAADLALAAPFREAVLNGEPTRELFDSLSPLRADAIVMLAPQALVARWGSSEPMPPALEYTIAVNREADPVESYARDAVPNIHLRARFAGSKAMVDANETRSRPLRPLDQQIMSVLSPLSRSRKGFYASGINASILAHLLRQAGATLERTNHRVRFADTAIALRIVRTAAPNDTVEPVDADGNYRGRGNAPKPALVDALEARWRSQDGTIDVPAHEVAFFHGPFPFVWIASESAFFPLDRTTDQTFADQVQKTPVIALQDADPVEVFRLLRTRLRGRTIALPPAEVMGLPSLPEPTFVVRIDGTPLDVVARIEARYPSSQSYDLVPYELLEQDDQRDVDLEAAAVSELIDAGLVYEPAKQAFVIAGEDAIPFWEQGITKLRAALDPPLELVIANALRNVRVRAPVRSRVRVSMLAGWLDTAVTFESDEVAADMRALKDALANGRRWVTLDDGSLARITETVAELVNDVSAALPEDAKGRLAAHQLGRLDRWIETAGSAEIDGGLESLRSRLRALAVQLEVPVPEGLEATLRPYQNRGLAWLQFLDELGAGGILADDMGLGKTVMTLALILARKQRDGARPSLVVCPTSVAGNWVREAARFTPDLKVLLLHGAGRQERRGSIAEHDLIVTTYTLLRDDIDALDQIDFRYTILDEAQNIKNAEAITTQAARRLRSEGRLALTGTPVENRLMELWSIMDFCNPGMLGTARDFEKRFERAIASDPKGNAARVLHATIRPFVLRRTKREVLTDLPPKEEIDLSCVLGTRQRQQYDALATVLRGQVEKTIRDKGGVAASGMSILTALLRLRQMACDPRLIDPALPPDSSAKRAAFLERVRELAAEGRRALVFSQFVELLTLWRKDLDAEGIAYEYLDGSTRDREERVERFQNGSAPLFLISLRAGGTGLNLTAADTVIHCDPWWNPAVEDQATDRAHRIGQQRAVTVYRLVARGTVEDSIMTLKTAKRGLADAVIREDAGALRGLSEEDVRTLLGNVADPTDESAAEPEPDMPPVAEAPA